MTSFKQADANRRNARKITSSISEEGKQRSRCNAVRHGLTAETVIGALEDAEDYKAFEVCCGGCAAPPRALSISGRPKNVRSTTAVHDRLPGAPTEAAKPSTSLKAAPPSGYAFHIHCNPRKGFGCHRSALGN
jgi:hypothetical protein